MYTSNLYPPVDPVDNYWVKQFKHNISDTERFQFERALQFFSLTDPLTFLMAHLIHIAHINANEREGKFLAKGQAAADMAEQLITLHVRLMELIPQVDMAIRALQRDAERVEKSAANWYKAHKCLKTLGLDGYVKPSWHAIPVWIILVFSLVANAAVELIFN